MGPVRIALHPRLSAIEGDAHTLATVRRALTAPSLEYDAPDVCVLDDEYQTFPTGLVPLVSRETGGATYLPDATWMARHARVGIGPHGQRWGTDPPRLNGKVPRDDQAQAWREIVTAQLNGGLPFPRGIIKFATGSGKTLILALCALSVPGRVVVFASEKGLVWQLQDELAQMTGERVGLVQGSTHDEERITVISVQTLMEMGGIESLLKGQPLDAKLYDECHHYSSGEVFREATLGDSAPLIVGVSGTPWREDKPLAGLYAQGLCGPVLAELTPGDAIEKGITSDVQVTYFPVHVPPYVWLHGQQVYLASLPWKRRAGRDGYTHAIVRNEARNQLFTNLALGAVKQGLQVLTVVYAREHGVDLASRLGCPFLDGQTPDSVRKVLQTSFREGRLRQLVSTVMKEGIDIPNLDMVNLAGGGRSPIQVNQAIGRTSRRTESKKRVYVNDTFDTGHPVSVKHSRERIRICRQAGYTVCGAVDG